LELPAHAYRWAEPRLRDADWAKADPFVETLRGAGGHLERFSTLICRARGRVFNERSADANPIWFDEQPVELVDRTIRRNDD
jgi:hypothetical protein